MQTERTILKLYFITLTFSKGIGCSAAGLYSSR